MLLNGYEKIARWANRSSRVLASAATYADVISERDAALLREKTAREHKVPFIQDVNLMDKRVLETRSDGTFSRADFVFERERYVYICPGEKLLHTTGTVIDGGTLRYRASKIAKPGCFSRLDRIEMARPKP